jgi:transglutaminase-like putative cysteine protease
VNCRSSRPPSATRSSTAPTTAPTSAACWSCSTPTRAASSRSGRRASSPATSPTRALLADINEGIHKSFGYGARHDEGTQAPLETLALGTGTCRDFALLMMEALRALGIATRFVSGYLYDPALDTAGDGGIQGAGATHAWLEVYLPGAGWVEYDPTNGLVGSNSLIRVAVTRDPSQAIPISGSYSGPSGAFQGMEVSVEVTSGDAEVRMVPEAETKAEAA